MHYTSIKAHLSKIHNSCPPRYRLKTTTTTDNQQIFGENQEDINNLDSSMLKDLQEKLNEFEKSNVEQTQEQNQDVSSEMMNEVLLLRNLENIKYKIFLLAFIGTRC